MLLTPAPLTFGKPQLNNCPAFDDAQFQKSSNFWVNVDRLLTVTGTTGLCHHNSSVLRLAGLVSFIVP